MMKMWRIYFNQRGEKPWSFDDGDPASETTVHEVEIHGKATTRYTGGALQPIAWIEIRAELKWRNSTPVFWGEAWIDQRPVHAI